MFKKYAATLILTLTLLSSNAQVSNQEPKQDPAIEYFTSLLDVAFDSHSNFYLYKFVYDWLGTPYRFGGETKNGIDCSAFVKTAYEVVFGKTIKRNSREIYKTTTPLSREDLKPGDLVFFKIRSRVITHVGIYMGNNKFAQSSNQGVNVSDLNNPYWNKYFYKGGRL